MRQTLRIMIDRLFGRQPSQVWIRLLVVLLVFVLLIAFLIWYKSDESSAAGSRFVFLALVNFNIILLAALAFLIGRNVVKLVFDRRRRILGAALRMRLVIAFVVLTLIPTSILFMFASGLLTTAIEGWFSSPVERAVGGAVEVARLHYNYVRDDLGRDALALSRQVEYRWKSGAGLRRIKSYLSQKRQSLNLYAIRVLDQKKKVLTRVYNAAALIDTFGEPRMDQTALEKALKGEIALLSAEKEGGEYLSAYVPLDLGGEKGVLLATLRVLPDTAHAMALVDSSYKEYQELQFRKTELKSVYRLVLTMITGSLLFAAIWTGFYVARVIAVPIQRVAEGTREVAGGNYNVEIEASGDDEIGLLVRSFNQMTADLKLARETAEGRRVYLETILSNLAVGVVGLDRRGMITSINAAFGRLYGLESPDTFEGSSLSALLRPEDQEQIAPLLEKLEEEESSGAVLEREVELASAGRKLKIVCTAGRVTDAQGNWTGSVLLFDNITELAKAQHMAAWREVAQRIAHEIKNPLTPIQLSAQRLQRLLSGEQSEPAVNDSVHAIVENVDSIKRLANEFSNFARMPTAEFKACRLNDLIADAIAPYAESHSDIVFQFIGDSRMPDVRLDSEQMRRVVINLIENAIDAFVRGGGGRNPGGAARIVVKTSYDRRRKVAAFEVCDNGPGVKGVDRSRIFEPYFTTKKGGTGLGLAIVTSIVADHQGEIRLHDNSPSGAKFIVELPVSPKEVTGRRFTGV